MPDPLSIIYEDNHLLVINKPAGLPTMGVAEDRPSVLSVAKDYIKHRYNKPGNVYLGVVSRLDAPVTGVLVIARTSKAAKRLNEQFRGRSIDKIYWALIEGKITPAEGLCVDRIAEDKRHRRMWVVGPTIPDAKEGRLTYRTLAPVKKGTLLEVHLETGRKHQIRLQLAERGHPVLGDRKYGSVRRWPHGIALHARRLTIEHPVLREPITFEAPLPKPWETLVDVRGL
jgi:23S rRNA pseudouridine1911/1915/1917 synthase